MRHSKLTDEGQRAPSTAGGRGGLLQLLADVLLCHRLLAVHPQGKRLHLALPCSRRRGRHARSGARGKGRLLRVQALLEGQRQEKQ